MAKIRMDAEFGWYVGFRFTHESVRVSGGESSFFIGPFASHAAAAIWVAGTGASGVRSAGGAAHRLSAGDIRGDDTAKLRYP
jgi:hypothetical protein